MTLGFPGNAAAPAWARRRISPAMGRGGMVAAAHPHIVSTGLEVLKAGGNAVDAAVAAGLTASVVMPEMCGLGGDLFAIVHRPGEAPMAVLGSGISPRGASLEMVRAAGDQGPNGVRMPFYGPLSISVPGMVDAYETLLGRWGTRGFAELAGPAIGYAEGFALTPLGAEMIRQLRRLIAAFPATAAVFLPGGEVPKAGTVLRQAGLAATLRRLCDAGPRDFYEGEIAGKIADFLGANGGAMSRQDLAGHATVVEAPIETTYRGRRIYQTGLPSQGLILLEALNIVERAESADLAKNDAAAVHLQAEALKRAYADRLGHVQDPAAGASPVAKLISKDWAEKRAADINPLRASVEVAAAQMQDGDTTYLCVADGSGMMVSLIQSVSAGFGSGMVAGETGIILNNRAGRGFTLDQGHPNQYAPSKKTISTLNCYMVADPEGRVVLVGGTPGGDGQPQWGLQALVGMIDGGLDVQAAIEAPRWMVFPGTDPSTLPNPYRLRVENRMDEAVMAGLQARAHTVDRQGPWDGGGGAQIIARDPETGVLVGGSDPRTEGLALGF